MNVLGFDPGLAKVGWAVGEVVERRLRITALGTWKTTKSAASAGHYADHVQRGCELAMRADLLMETHRPLHIYAEEVGRMPSAIAYSTYRFCGGVRLAAALREINYAEITAMALKKLLTGDRKAIKETVEADVTQHITDDALMRFRKQHPQMKASTKRGIRDHAFDAGGAIVAGLVRAGLIDHVPMRMQRKRRAS